MKISLGWGKMRALCKGQLQALNLRQERALYLLEAKFFFVSWSAHQPLRWAHCSLYRGLSQPGKRGWVRTENYGLSPGAIHLCFLLRLGKPRLASEPGLGCDRAFIRGLWGTLAPAADTFARRAGAGSRERGSALTSGESAGLEMVAGWWSGWIFPAKE